MNKILPIAIGGGIGAVLRYQIQGWVQDRLGAAFPYGTLVVNISGAFLIGLLMTIFLDHFEATPAWRLFLVVGILGGYTTFSALTWETYQLLAAGSLAEGALYAGGSFAGGMAGLWIGVIVGRLI